MIATTSAHEVYRLGLAGSVALSGIETSGNGGSWGLPATAGIIPAPAEEEYWQLVGD